VPTFAAVVSVTEKQNKREDDSARRIDDWKKTSVGDMEIPFLNSPLTEWANWRIF
jgi:hypothetical protein